MRWPSLKKSQEPTREGDEKARQAKKRRRRSTEGRRLKREKALNDFDRDSAFSLLAHVALDTSEPTANRVRAAQTYLRETRDQTAKTPRRTLLERMAALRGDDHAGRHHRDEPRDPKADETGDTKAGHSEEAG